jgi:hypothetical protein
MTRHLVAPEAVQEGVKMSNMMKVGWVFINNERGLAHGRCHIFREAPQFCVINSSNF